MSVRDNHEHAMSLADEAFAAKRRGDTVTARNRFQEALQYERLAAQSVMNDAEPTRSILYRSAASLALACSEYREAERLIATALCGSPPDEIASELRLWLRRVHHLSPLASF
jgi:hypothetical protein